MTAPSFTRVAEGVYRRGDGQYTARAPWRGGPSKTFAKLADARTWRANVKRDHDTGALVPKRAERTTVADECTRYLELNAPRWAPATYVVNESRIRTMVTPTLGRLTIHTLSVSQVEAWVNTLTGRGYSPRVVNQARAQLRRALDVAVRDRRLSVNVAAIARPVSVGTPEVVDAPEGAAMAAVRAALPAHLRLVCDLALGAGLRFSEIAGLTMDRVNVAERTVTVDRQWIGRGARAGWAPPKHASGRTVPVPASLIMAINGHVATYGLGAHGVIVHEQGGRLRHHDGQPLDAHRWCRAWETARLAASVDLRGIHQLRHAFGSWHLAHGESPADVARWMGHRSVATLLGTYTHPSRAARPSTDVLAHTTAVAHTTRTQGGAS